jgi:nicotinamidase/pyrazinamidase
MIEKNKNALLVIDIQNDFCPGGKLAIKESEKVIPIINQLTQKFDRVVATQDWHPENHISFARNHPGAKNYDIIQIEDMTQVLWPAHCVRGTKGAEFHSDVNTNNLHLILRKGTDPEIDSYSAFMENDKKTITGLEGYLKGLNITQVFISGLATDYCVFYSAMDAKRLGFETYVIIDACRGVDVPENNVENAINTMQGNDIKIISSSEL